MAPTVISQSSARPTSTQSRPVRPLARPHHPPLAPHTPVQSQPQPKQTSDTPTARSVRRLEPDPNPFPNRPGRKGLSGEAGVFESGKIAQARSRRFLKIGIETEFYLQAFDPNRNKVTVEDFVKILAKNHNKNIPSRYPRMRERIRPFEYSGPYNKWCLVLEDSLGAVYLPWPIELVSPVFKAFPGSTWREDVELTWSYLSKYYNILGNDLCATHIHVGLEPGFDLTDLKRIAQAAVHFETAFEALVPSSRRGNYHTKSNWLDTFGFAEKGKSRPDTIDAIGATSSPQQLLDLLHPLVGTLVSRDRRFSWNFLGWSKNGSLEFRKPPVSLTAVDALSWAELAMSFVQASMGCNSSVTLQEIPPTTGGLHWFLDNFGTQPGVNEPSRLRRFWSQTSPELFIEPKPLLQDETELELKQVRELYGRLMRMANEDKARVRALIKNRRGRYW